MRCDVSTWVSFKLEGSSKQFGNFYSFCCGFLKVHGVYGKGYKGFFEGIIVFKLN